MTSTKQTEIIQKINKRIGIYRTTIEVEANDTGRQNSFKFTLDDPMIDGTPVFTPSNLLTKIVERAVGKVCKIKYNNTGTIFNLYEK